MTLVSRLKLSRPLIILDVETTGTHPQVDRIVQIGLVKLYPDGRQSEWMSLINPGVPIPPELLEVHGITDADVLNAPTFRAIAPRLAGGLMGSDFGGYNVGFDMQFLKAEFARVGGSAVLSGYAIVDSYRIYSQKFPRRLADAYKHYTGKDLIGAHDALVDAKAAAEVFLAQLAQHDDLPDNVQEIHKIYFEKIAQGHLDAQGKLAWRHNQATINFGKYATVPLRDVPRSYLEWMLRGEFSDEVKRIINQAISGHYPVRNIG